MDSPLASPSFPDTRRTWIQSQLLAGEVGLAAIQQRLMELYAEPLRATACAKLRLSSERAVHQVRPSTTDAELAQIVADTCAELDERVDELLRKRRWMLARQEAR